MSSAFTAIVPLLLGLLLPLVLAQRPYAVVSTRAGALVLALCLFASFRIGRILSTGRRDLMTLTFYLFVYVWFGLVAFLVLDAGPFAFRVEFLGSDFARGVKEDAPLLIWLGIGAYEAGSIIARVRPLRMSKNLTAPATWRHRRLVTLCWIAILVTPVLVATNGGVRILLTSREDFGDAFAGDGGYIELVRIIAIRILPFAAAYAAVSARRQLSLSDLRPSRALVLLTVAVAAITNNPVVTERSIFGAMSLSLAFAYVRPWQKSGLRFIVVATVVGLLTLYPLANQFRHSDAPNAQTYSGVYDTFTRSPDFGMYGQVHTAIEYVREEGNTFGRQMLRTVLFFAPRTIWSSKPEDTGDVMHDALGYPERLNQSSPLWTEFYIDGGAVFLALGFAFYGFASARIERLHRAGQLGRFGTFLPVIAAYQLYLLRGSLAAFVPRFTALILILLWLTQPRSSSRLRHRRPRAAAFPSA